MWGYLVRDVYKTTLSACIVRMPTDILLSSVTLNLPQVSRGRASGCVSATTTIRRYRGSQINKVPCNFPLQRVMSLSTFARCLEALKAVTTNR